LFICSFIPVVFQTYWAICDNIGIPDTGNLETSLAMVNIIATTSSLQFAPKAIMNG
jgi:hypothetical protein